MEKRSGEPESLKLTDKEWKFLASQAKGFRYGEANGLGSVPDINGVEPATDLSINGTLNGVEARIVLPNKEQGEL